MKLFRRRESVEELFERLRMASAECSGDGLEETEEIEMVQTSAVSTAPREYCCRCNIGFGLAERRVAVALGQVAHEDCYEKILGDEQRRQQRIHGQLEMFTSRVRH